VGRLLRLGGSFLGGHVGMGFSLLGYAVKLTLSGWRSQAGAHRLFWGRSLTRLKCAEFRDDGLQRGFRVRIMARMNAGNFGC
jgi:hypothetical protein